MSLARPEFEKPGSSVSKEDALSYMGLGATLYVPATRPSLHSIFQGEKFCRLRSAVLCLEDSVHGKDVAQALRNTEKLCVELQPSGMARFIRVRNQKMLDELVKFPGIDNFAGFVLPKITAENIDSYLSILPANSDHVVMPTLESQEVFDLSEMKRLRDRICTQWFDKILCLRIGGNDLLNLLGIRRAPRKTIYDTLLASTLAQLITIFRPYGLELTAPVYDQHGCLKTLKREVEIDVEHGLFGKTSIHPCQIATIENGYEVDPVELRMSEEILKANAPAVFSFADTMCEPITNWRWANKVLHRNLLYGVRGISANAEERMEGLSSVALLGEDA